MKCKYVLEMAYHLHETQGLTTSETKVSGDMTAVLKHTTTNVPLNGRPHLVNIVTGVGSFSPLLGVRKKLYIWWTGHIYLKLVI